MFLRLIILWFLGTIETLLITRLVLRLMAARPDNPVVELVYGVTTPLLQPVAVLDSGQPQFGAMLELSTLVLILVIAIGLLGMAYMRHKTHQTDFQ